METHIQDTATRRPKDSIMAKSNELDIKDIAVIFSDSAYSAGISAFSLPIKTRLWSVYFVHDMDAHFGSRGAS